jgi:hypothetical protein
VLSSLIEQGLGNGAAYGIAAADPVKGALAEIALRPGGCDAKVAVGSFLVNADGKNGPDAERLAREALNPGDRPLVRGSSYRGRSGNARKYLS